MLRLVCLALLATLATTLADPHQVRRWTGKNGKSFEGAYMGKDPESGKYKFALNNDKTFLIDPTNISEADLQWLKNALETKKPNPNPKDGDPKFLPDPELDRKTLPVIDQNDYGSKSNDCVPSSFCNFLLWWDQQNYLPIDRRGGFDKKAEYIHSKVARYFGTRNNSGTSMHDAEAGIREYFEKDLSELATVHIQTDYDCSPKNIERYAVGPAAVLLQVSCYYGDDPEGGHVMALSHVDENGDLIFITWGARLRGRLRDLGEVKRLPDGTPPKPGTTLKKYDLVIQNRADLPEWAIENEVRFQIEPSEYDSIMVITPYRYKEKGQKSPPPPEPPKRGEISNDTTISIRDFDEPYQGRETLDRPQLPHKFKHPISYSRDWTNRDQSTVSGEVSTCDAQTIHIETNEDPVRISLQDLSPADHARALLWRGATGERVTISSAKLDYRLSISGHHIETVRIFISNEKFRLELADSKPPKCIVGDTETGAFATYHGDKLIRFGRVESSALLPGNPWLQRLDDWEKFRDSIPFAKQGTHPEAPCRLAVWRGSKIDQSFNTPALQFSCAHSPSLIAALNTLLVPPQAWLEENYLDRRKRRLLHLIQTPLPKINDKGASYFLGTCRGSNLIPIRLKWEGVSFRPQPGQRSISGQATSHDLNLQALEFGPQPSELFEIPEAYGEFPINVMRVVKE